MTEFNNQNQVFSESDIDSDDITISELEEDDLKIEERDIHEPFDPTKIRVATRPMTIDLVLDRIEHDEINLAPDFQRYANIWDDQAQSLLIESILIRIPLPAFYMDATDEDHWLVIDGLQRLSTLKKFILDQKLKLTRLEFLTNLEDKNYDELPRNYQRRIKETVLNVYLIEKGTPPEVKFNIFRRINTGGEPLSPQELRHALNPGKATKFLDRLAKSQEFIEITNLGKKRKQRMDDHEFVLGFVAFSLTPYHKYPVKKGRDYFLNEAMIKINKMDNSMEQEVENKFQYAMKAASDIFGDSAFRKMSRKNRKYPINKALFEAWSVTLSQLNSQELEILKTKSKILKDKFIEQMEKDKDFLASISQAANKVEYRFMTIEQIVQEVLL
ncbi:DUF262 domain-containing protein [Lyngbya sp. PCC 8106]|uniref:DUF262 domain-containing protein n=1 Tax=Lyngbya sp. (strain PCC 8106) TaxID=313612 RepID=UPI0000EAB17F|nr:DUF262 domain-containing protein [Lyngbya sp. PCC 8106]EAW35770.1 hypothetical protein L8106_28221 [Lyngbya sp. PCC 8106]